MLNNMPKTGEYIFNTRVDTIHTGFTKQRTRLARILQNPQTKTGPPAHFTSLEGNYGISSNQKHKVRPTNARPQKA
jgi:hypothetical protein